MTPVTAALTLAGVNGAIMFVLAADRWIHRVTGKAPLEARISTLEDRVEKINKDGSDNFTRIQHKMGELELDMREVKTRLKMREDTPRG